MLTPEERTMGRRTFLKALATVPALGAFGWVAYKERLQQRPIQAGIIGSGSEGRVLLEVAPAESIQFKALADIRPDSRKAGLEVIKKRWGIEADVYPDDYTKLLERKDLEAVVIATPLWAHAKMAIDALDAGKHVFCEKTMAHDLEDAKAMVRASWRSRRVLQIGHQRRANRLYAQALEMIRQGAIGEIYHVRTLWHRNNDWRRDDQVAALRQSAPEFDPTPWGYGSLEELVNWRLYRKYSQGLMAELASHQLDVTNWFSGAVPLRVLGSGGVYRWKDGRNVDDHVYVTCEYPSGTLAPGALTVTFSSITSNQFDNYYEQFMGTKGTIILTGETEAMLFKEGEAAATEIEVTRSPAGAPVMEASRSRLADAAGSRPEAIVQPSAGMDRLEPYRAELEGFCSAVRFGTPPPCSGEAALEAAALVIKANEAIATRRAMELKPEVYSA